MTHRTPAPARVAAMSECIGRLHIEAAQRQTHFDAMANTPQDLLVADADAALKRAGRANDLLTRPQRLGDLFASICE